MSARLEPELWVEVARYRAERQARQRAERQLALFHKDECAPHVRARIEELERELRQAQRRLALAPTWVQRA
jgi:hypothetical protein